jgi:hypothetical protein
VESLEAAKRALEAEIELKLKERELFEARSQAAAVVASRQQGVGQGVQQGVKQGTGGAVEPPSINPPDVMKGSPVFTVLMGAFILNALVGLM